MKWTEVWIKLMWEADFKKVPKRKWNKIDYLNRS